jgi:hypothetical protein
MEAVMASETLANFYEIPQRSILEDNHIHTRRHVNLKSHKYLYSHLTAR